MKYIVLILVILAMVSSCKKDKPNYWFTGMEIVDTNGNFVRWAGQQDDDWKVNKYTLSYQQLYAMTLDSLSDTASWNHTNAGTVTLIPGTNPVGWDTGIVNYNFQVSFGTNAYFSYLASDEYGTTLASHSYYGLSGNVITVNVPLPSSLVQPGSACRIYYAFSAHGNVFFAQGWGDIGVCSKDTITHMVNACF